MSKRSRKPSMKVMENLETEELHKAVLYNVACLFVVVLLSLCMFVKVEDPTYRNIIF